MDELTPAPLNRTLTLTDDNAALNDLLTALSATPDADPSNLGDPPTPTTSPKPKPPQPKPLPVFKAPDGVEYSGPPGPTGETIIASDPIFTSPEPPMPKKPTPKPAVKKPQPETSAAETLPNLLFFTGHPKSGVSFLVQKLGGTELSFHKAAQELTEEILDLSYAESPGFATQIAALGEGAGDKTSLLHAVVTMFIRNEVDKDFGNPGFWFRRLQAAAKRLTPTEPGFSRRVIVTGVNRTADFNALSKAGFQHWHIMASPATRGARAGAPTLTSKFLTGLDHSVISQTSAQPIGQKLHCVWSDEVVGVNSDRLWKVSDFLALK